MMKIAYSQIATLLTLSLLTACRRDEQVKTYTVQKDQAAATATAQPAPSPMSMMSADGTAVPVNAAPIHWTTPAAWKQLPPDGIRLGNFSVPGQGDKAAAVAITSFPGTVGGALANVNRWRGQVGLPDTTESEIKSDKITVDGTEGSLYDISGAADRIVVAMIVRDGASWFIKLTGDKETVAGAQATYLDFLKSVHFGGAVAAAPVDPHAGMAMPPQTAQAAPSGGPQWSAPANWSETTPGAMVTKSYAVPGDAGQTAAVTISVLSGEGGCTLSNVNRWRGQLGLPAITSDALPSNIASLDVAAGKATLVDLAGTAGHPGRMLAVIVPQNGQTWFYKLTGDAGVVAREKDKFLEFVRTSRYP